MPGGASVSTRKAEASLATVGGDGRNRTGGLRIANAALSQLSYIPKELAYAATSR